MSTSSDEPRSSVPQDTEQTGVPDPDATVDDSQLIADPDATLDDGGQPVEPQTHRESEITVEGTDPDATQIQGVDVLATVNE